MKISRVVMVNFCGFEGTKVLEMQHLAALTGPNGTGKTTILNAIRYGLTGEEPDGDIINKKSDTCRVSIIMEDPADGVVYEFMRQKDREKPSKCFINGKTTTQKSMNEKIEQIIGIGLDKVKVLSSAEVVAAMKPQEFSTFILDYIPEKLKLEKVISMIPDTTIGMINILEANLPEENIEMSDIEDFDKMCRAYRKDLKDNLARKKALYDTLPKEAPESDKAAISKELEELTNAEAARKIYLEKKAAYDRALALYNKNKEQKAALQAEADAIKVSRPDPAEAEVIQKEMAEVKGSADNLRISITSATNAVRQMEVSLANLNNPVCPLSEKIVCHQDKSAAKEELIESITSSKEGIEALKVEMEKATKKIEECEKKLEEYRENSRLYEKRISILKQIKMLEDSEVELPPVPEVVETPDVAARTAELKQKLREYDAYAEGCTIAGQIEAITNELNDYEKLVKAIAEKGPVRTGIINSYLKVFEDICNERSGKFRPTVHFTFISDDGVKVLMDPGKDVALPYEALSGGERAYMIFIIMDMLNCLCGTKIMLLDELSVIDQEVFAELLEIVKEYAGDYDHILLAAVDHEDTVDLLKAQSIPIL